jgi:hypothetical protein
MSRSTETSGVRLALVFAVALSLCGVACDGGPTAPSGVTSKTFLSFESDPGDYIGQGQSRAYALQDGTWNARFNSSNGVEHASVSVTQFGGPSSFWWYLELAAPKGGRLVPGRYEAARRFPFQPDTQPGLSFSGSGRGCNILTGWFRIYEIEIGPGGIVERLEATFEQNCEGASPALRGQVSIAANPWR